MVVFSRRKANIYYFCLIFYTPIKLNGLSLISIGVTTSQDANSIKIICYTIVRFVQARDDKFNSGMLLFQLHYATALTTDKCILLLILAVNHERK